MHSINIIVSVSATVYCSCTHTNFVCSCYTSIRPRHEIPEDVQKDPRNYSVHLQTLAKKYQIGENDRHEPAEGQELNWMGVRRELNKGQIGNQVWWW